MLEYVADRDDIELSLVRQLACVQLNELHVRKPLARQTQRGRIRVSPDEGQIRKGAA